MVRRKSTRMPSLPDVDERQLGLFDQPDEVKRQRGQPSLDGLLTSDRGDSGLSASLLSSQPYYGITSDYLTPFFSKVTIRDRQNKTIILSHQDHFFAAQKAYFGVFAMESHRDDVLTGEWGVPHEVLAQLKPYERLSLYMGCYEVKATRDSTDGKARYVHLSKLSFNALVMALIDQGLQYNSIRIMKRKDDKATPTSPLNHRLSQVRRQAQQKFSEAFGKPLISVRDPYESQPKPGQSNNSYYYNGIDTYVGKLVGVFQELWKMKTTR